MNSYVEFQEKYQQPFSKELMHFIDNLFPASDTCLKEIFIYHLGLDDTRQGKRIRPFLLFLATEGAGGKWEKAMPAAVAVELIHNFSLIHDDIEDNGQTRHGKSAVWQKWGLAQGLNAGDAMLASAFLSLSSLNHKNKQLILEVQKVFYQTCLELTHGQQMDIEFSGKSSIKITEYLEMVRGKTAALFACCMRTGACLGGSQNNVCNQYALFGQELGMVFQLFDDFLGIWGDEKITGKSTCSDLKEKKVSYPVLIGLERSPRFREAWTNGIESAPVTLMAHWLSEDGIKEFVKKEYEARTVKAFDILEQLECKANVKEALKDLTLKLITREN